MCQFNFKGISLYMHSHTLTHIVLGKFQLSRGMIFLIFLYVQLDIFLLTVYHFNLKFKIILICLRLCVQLINHFSLKTVNKCPFILIGHQKQNQRNDSIQDKLKEVSLVKQLTMSPETQGRMHQRKSCLTLWESSFQRYLYSSVGLTGESSSPCDCYYLCYPRSPL